MADTANFGWTKPTVGGDPGAWGTILNTLFDDVDTDVDAIKTTADAAMPVAGGSFTGQVENKTDRYVLSDKGSMSGAVTLNVNSANFFHGTVAAAVTFTFSNPPASGKVMFFFLEVTNGSAFAITWPASVAWPGGASPTLTASGVDVLVFYTRDNGTTWRGALAMEDSS